MEKKEQLLLTHDLSIQDKIPIQSSTQKPLTPEQQDPKGTIDKEKQQLAKQTRWQTRNTLKIPSQSEIDKDCEKLATELIHNNIQNFIKKLDEILNSIKLSQDCNLPYDIIYNYTHKAIDIYNKKMHIKNIISPIQTNNRFNTINLPPTPDYENLYKKYFIIINTISKYINNYYKKNNIQNLTNIDILILNTLCNLIYYIIHNKYSYHEKKVNTTTIQHEFEKTMIKEVEKNIDIMKELYNENEITYHEKYPGYLCTILSVSYDDQAQVNNTRSYVIQITKKAII